MFTIEKTGPRDDKDRLIALAALSEADFVDIARALDTRPVRARKTALIAAREAAASERIETRWNGSETTNTARPGDWVATTLTADCEVLRDGDGHPTAMSYRRPTSRRSIRPSTAATISAVSMRRAVRSQPCICPVASRS